MDKFRAIVPFTVHTSASSSSSAAVTFEGYASVFNTPIDALSGPTIIERGAFKKTLAEQWERIKILWQHNSDEPIGRPLEMREDEHGLRLRAVLSSTQRGREAAQLLKDGVIREMSIGFDPIKFYMDRTGPEPVRRLTEIKLWEISLVTHAANPLAVVTQIHKRALSVDERIADLDALDRALEAFDTRAAIRREHQVWELQLDYLEALGGIR
jgi:HK97 family phage prohead protease